MNWTKTPPTMPGRYLIYDKNWNNPMILGYVGPDGKLYENDAWIFDITDITSRRYSNMWWYGPITIPESLP